MQSSSIRGKAAFVPWLAALVFGAAANAGWIVHELRHQPQAQVQAAAPQGPPVIVNVELAERGIPSPDPQLLRRAARREALRHRAERRAHARARTRCARADEVSGDPADELAAWIVQRASYSYTIDRRALEYFAPRGLVVDRPSLDALATALDHAEPIELRNIRGGTPLWALGLRNGDRLLRLITGEHEDIERVVLAVERRGRVVALSYELV